MSPEVGGRYRAYQLSLLNQKARTVNGKIKVNTRHLVLGALFEPTDVDASLE